MLGERPGFASTRLTKRVRSHDESSDVGEAVALKGAQEPREVRHICTTIVHLSSLCHAVRMVDSGVLQGKYEALRKQLDERSYRLCLAADAAAFGYGGISRVAEASGASRSTIHAGLRDLKENHETTVPGNTAGPRRVRRPRGGRKARAETDATLLDDLNGACQPY